MKGSQIVFEEQGRAVLQSVDIPEPEPETVWVENDYTVISAGTETANFLGLPNTARKFPYRPGYCGAGRVVALGAGVESVQPGTRVLSNWGGHRSHRIQRASELIVIPDDDIDLLEASFALIASFSFLGVRKLRIELGESALIAGLGLLGLFAVQLAALSGAVPVLAADFDRRRRELARRLGAEHVFDPGDRNYIENVKSVTGGQGVDAVVEVTGASAALQQALEFVAWQGRISLLGCTRVSDTPIDFYTHVHRRGVSLIGAHAFTRPKQESSPGHRTERDDCRTFLKILAARKIQVRPLISEIVSPEEAPTVYPRLAQTKHPPLGMVFDWSKIR